MSALKKQKRAVAGVRGRSERRIYLYVSDADEPTTNQCDAYHFSIYKGDFMSTIAAISTPFGTGGIAVVRVTGENSIQVCDKVFKAKALKPVTMLPANTAAFGYVNDLSGNLIDECVLTVFKAPSSYTGEDLCEISCHGGIKVTASVLSAVLLAGAQPAGAGEFTKRAFLNGKMDLTRAEAVIDLINADNNMAQKAALWQLEGAVGKHIVRIMDALLAVNAQFLAFVDYPDDEIADISPEKLLPELENAKTEIQKLIKSFDYGSVIKDGVRCAIIGKPNTGKSSLMNLLSGFDKSIVTEHSGTTRDVIEETVILGGVKLILSDTAGVRETEDDIEKIGVERTFKTANLASFILCVFDGGKDLSAEDEKLAQYCQNKMAVALINKIDLPEKINKEYIKARFKHIVYISALTGKGLEDLEATISDLFSKGDISIEKGELITNIRHKNCLEKALLNIEKAEQALKAGITPDAITIDISEAISALGEITGQTVNEEIVKTIFDRFCVGK